MQITFDPLNPQEAQAVRAFLGDGHTLVQNFTISGSEQPEPMTEAQFKNLVGSTRYDPVPLPTLDFTPGAVGAPLVADAAASPTAPEAPPVSSPPQASAPAAPAPAPSAPSAPAAPSTSAPSVDSSGLPWDERIHAANKSTVQDGKWRKKRGVDDALVTAVEAELRARAIAPPPPVVVPPPPLAQAPAAPTAPTPPSVTPPAPPAGPDVSTFRGLMEWLTPLMTTGKIPFQSVSAAVQSCGLNVLSDLSQPQHVAKVLEVYNALNKQ